VDPRSGNEEDHGRDDEGDEEGDDEALGNVWRRASWRKADGPPGPGDRTRRLTL
jgi:hypothetical protein